MGRRRGPGTARTPLPLRGGVLGFGRLVEAALGLPPGRLPAADGAQTDGVLAVALVPAPRLKRVATALAQTEARPQAAWPGVAAALGLIMRAAHGSAVSQGTARGERGNVLLGRLSAAAGRPTILHEKRRQEGPKETAKETA